MIEDEERSYLYFEDVNWGLLRLWGKRSGLDVLDVGCGFATTSEHIQRRGNRVTGIESSDVAVKTASTRLHRVIHEDLQNLEAVKAAAGGQFDVLVFADVLEHLSWPAPVLRGYLDLLREDGRIIISLPNVGLWSVRLSLMAGRFDYADTGVLDRTHLRFFTRRTARELLSAAALREQRVVYNPGIVRPFVPLAKKLFAGGSGGGEHNPSALLESAPYRAYLKTVYPLERMVARMWPGMLAFQMIFEARRA
jgi:2-polyprenyl-3-methyl-5-hydroxy-6-metoxy-1,4-benzoquinol methylase